MFLGERFISMEIWRDRFQKKMVLQQGWSLMNVAFYQGFRVFIFVWKKTVKFERGEESEPFPIPVFRANCFGTCPTRTLKVFSLSVSSPVRVYLSG